MMKLSSHLSQSLPPLFYSIRLILNTNDGQHFHSSTHSKYQIEDTHY